MKINNSHKSYKKPLLIAAASVIVIVGAYIAVAYYQKFPPFSKSDSTLPDSVNLKQTDTEKQAQKKAKDDPKSTKTTNSNTDTPSDPTTSPTSGLNQVNVVLTSSGQNKDVIQASGFVSNSTETDGVCTYTFSNSGTVVSKTSDTLPNPNSIACKTVEFPKAELSPGTWSVQLFYKSSQSEGSSNKMDITVS